MNNKNKAVKNKIIIRLGDILQDSDGILTLVKLNILFILSSMIFLPPVFVFTFGPSASALSYCTNRMVKTGYLPDVAKTYISVYKKSFRKSLVPGVFSVLSCTVFTLSLYIYLAMGSQNIIYIPLASVSMIALVFIIGTGIHMFPETALDEDRLPAKEYFIKGFYGMVNRLPSTIITTVISAGIVLIIVLLLPATLPLLLTIAFSAPAFVMAFAHTLPEFPE